MGLAKLTPQLSGNMINSKRYSLKIMHLAHLKPLLLIKQMRMGLNKTKEISTVEATIITTSMTITLTEDSSSKKLTINRSPKRVVSV